jgi:hypothetical protein
MALLLGTLKNKDVDLGRPAMELALPIVEGGFWYDDEVGSSDADMMAQIPKEGDCLQSFSQPHLIGEDAGNTILVQRNHPVQSSDLVVTHEALDEWW